MNNLALKVQVCQWGQMLGSLYWPRGGISSKQQQVAGGETNYKGF
jgi:hypothetical protein